jgi:hypothetical protein
MLMLRNELVLSRTQLNIHLVGLLQPTVFYLLMALILVHPTSQLNVVEPSRDEGRDLVEAMRAVVSPIGEPYIEPVLVSADEARGLRFVVAVEEREGELTAVHHFGTIDANKLKNLRNRLTAAALYLWNLRLGPRAVRITEHPTLPHDLPYRAYFGMSMLALAAMIAAGLIGAALIAHEQEKRTSLEYRLAPVWGGLPLTVRLLRLTVMGLLSVVLLLMTNGLMNGGFWPSSLALIFVILTPVALFGASLGTLMGLLFRRMLPSFLSTLVVTITCWFFGSSFGPASMYGGLYELFSWATPDTYAVQLMFPLFYGDSIAPPLTAAVTLCAFALGAVTLVSVVYHRRVLSPG